MSDHNEHSCFYCGDLLHFEDKCPKRPMVDKRGPLCTDECPLDCEGHTLYDLKALSFEDLKKTLEEENYDIFKHIKFLESQNNKLNILKKILKD